MLIKETKDLAKSAFEAYEACQGNYVQLRAWLLTYCASKFVFHHANGTDYTAEQMIQATSQAQASFPDYRSQICDIIAENDKVVISYVSQGTQKGPYMGAKPTGNTFQIKGVAIYKIEETKIVV